MATPHTREVASGRQRAVATPATQPIAAYCDRLLIVLNAVERLPEFSGGIVQAADEGAPYETLVRQLNVLHENIDELAQLAAKAKVMPIAEIVYSE